MLAPGVNALETADCETPANFATWVEFAFALRPATDYPENLVLLLVAPNSNICLFLMACKVF